MLSIQTNISSLTAQENLRVNSNFQSQTIQRLTSGYRINSSGDDAAGLAVANRYRSDTAELTQGVRNANDGLAQLQIADGGLSNISQMLDRLKTLATQSATSTFTGDRTTLNNEYQSLLGEIDRQAANVGMVSGGTLNTVLSVYIGGGSNASNSKVTVDLSGTANQVDRAGLSLTSTNISAAGTGLSDGTANAIKLNNLAGTFTGSSTFTFSVQGQGSINVVYDGAGIAVGDGAGAVARLNAEMAAAGITTVTASIGNNGMLQFDSGAAFTVKTGTVTGSGIATGASEAFYNRGLYAKNVTSVAGVTGAGSAGEAVTFTNGVSSKALVFDATTGATAGSAINYMNQQLNSIGIYAIADSSAVGFSLQSASTFTINKTAAATNGTVFGAVGAQALTNTTPAAGSSAASSAILSLNNAVAQLGVVQGRLGTGQNTLKYSISLAQSQISSFSAAQAQIRDTDIAAEAANLTKASVLQQASMAAMAQANSAPQAVLALLRG